MQLCAAANFEPRQVVVGIRLSPRYAPQRAAPSSRGGRGFDSDVVPTPGGVMRRSSLVLLAVCCAALGAMIAPRIARAAWPTNPTVNVPIVLFSNPAGTQMVDDGAGGAFLVWLDERSGGAGFAVWATHLTPNGLDPAWPAGGLALTNLSHGGVFIAACADGAGGLFCVWQDNTAGNYDILAQHVTAAGTIVSGWPATGLTVGATAKGFPATPIDDTNPTICPDGVGGFFVAWQVTYTYPNDYDIYANHINANGTAATGFTANGKLIDNALGIQDEPQITLDGSGGFYLVYEDNELGTGTFDIHMKEISSSGANETNGIFEPICTAAGDQRNPLLCTDGYGGALVCWQDGRSVPPTVYMLQVRNGLTYNNTWPNGGGQLETQTNATPLIMIPDGLGGAFVEYWVISSPNLLYVQHASGSGGVAPGWPATGVSPGAGGIPSVTADGSGGVIVAYNVGQDVYAIRYHADGTVAMGWSGGVPVTTAGYLQNGSISFGDGTGGSYFVWNDSREYSASDLYGQRVDRFGRLGDASPHSAGVKDVPGDQGGHVRVAWQPSYLDADPTYGVTQYLIFRQLPTSLALARLKNGARLASAADDPRDPLGGGGASRVIATGSSIATYYWEQIGNVPALALPGYSFDATTPTDSTGSANPRTLFMIEAWCPTGYWMSAPDSGYSVDNVAPAPPSPFTGTNTPGVGTQMYWGANHESDLAGYRVYWGTSPGFTPSPASRVVETPQTGYLDPYRTGFYKLSAYDVHGNESGYTTLVPTGFVGVDAAPLPKTLAFDRPAPDPMHDQTTLRMELPRAAQVSLVIYDAQGRAVRRLVDGPLEAGTPTLTWDGRTDDGHATAAGIYLARFEAEGQAFVQRIARLR
jgi:hypothetical protein